MLITQFKRGSASDNEQFVGESATLSLDLDNFQLRIHDGVTLGGHVLLKEASLTELESMLSDLAIEDVSALELVLGAKVALSQIGVPDGVAGLDSVGEIPSNQLPTYVNEVLEFDTLNDFPATGSPGSLYISSDNNYVYRWGELSNDYVLIATTPADTDDIDEGDNNLYFTDSRVRGLFSADGDMEYNSTTGLFSIGDPVLSVQGNVGEVTIDKTDFGLENVENYQPATKSEAEEATAFNKYVTPLRSRDFLGALGIVEEGGDWHVNTESIETPILNGTMSSISPMPTVRRGHDVASVNGTIYVAGGSLQDFSELTSLISYNPSTGDWSTLTDYPEGRHNASLTAIGNKLYLYGGNTNPTLTKTLYIYNINTGVWTTGTSGPKTCDRHSAVTVRGKMYVVGGWDGSVALKALRVFDPILNQWQSRANLPQERMSGVCEVAGGRIYYIGGQSSDTGPQTNTTYRYDVDSNIWSVLTPAPIDIHLSASFVVGDNIYVIGTENSTGQGDKIIRYNTKTDSWSDVLDLSVQRSGGVGISIDGVGYLIGGSIDGASYTANGWSIV